MTVHAPSWYEACPNTPPCLHAETVHITEDDEDPTRRCTRDGCTCGEREPSRPPGDMVATFMTEPTPYQYGAGIEPNGLDYMAAVTAHLSDPHERWGIDPDPRDAP